MTSRRWTAIVAVSLIVDVGSFAVPAFGERLAVRRYSTADGLSNDFIIGIYRDAQGFLWFSTRDGLSRFDGQRFTNYGIADGLPTSTINGVIQMRDGTYWIATNGGGVCRLNVLGRRPGTPQPPSSVQRAQEPLFSTFRVADEPAANRVNVLLEDRSGGLWAGTDAGLFHVDPGAATMVFRRVELPYSTPVTTFHGVSTIVEDGEGSLWIGGGWGLSRRLPDGRLVAYQFNAAAIPVTVMKLLLTDDNRIWIALGRGVLVIDREQASAFAGLPNPIVRMLSTGSITQSIRGARTRGISGRVYTTADGLPAAITSALFLSEERRLFVGSPGGLGVFDGQRFAAYTAANGLSGNFVTAVAEDIAGNIWLGTRTGVTRLIRHGLITYDDRDGLGGGRINSLGRDSTGALVVVTEEHIISRFDGRRFVSVRPRLPPGATCVWLSPCGYLDRSGQWWMLTAIGLYSLPRVPGLPELEGRSPLAAHTRAEGLLHDSTMVVYEDRSADLWIATAPEGITRWNRRTNSWQVYRPGHGLPPATGMLNIASAFGEDRDGGLWVGFQSGGVARFRNEQFELFTVSDGAPAGSITGFHVDRMGRLWIGSTESGLVRVDQPGAARPVFGSLPYGARMATTNVRCITDDAAGRIYVGTSRGVYRIDPETGRVKHFGTGEGLASDFVITAFRDARGMLWFGTISGLSRLDPAADRSVEPNEPPPVRISALRVRGVPHRVAELGDLEPKALTLTADQNQLEVEFFAVTFAAGESLKYQYRIEQVDGDWSRPSEARSVTYGRLPSGSHRLLVRAVSSNDVAGRTPAVVTFTVLPPIYARWWFIVLVGAVIGAAGLVAYRARVEQLLRVERVRARIATDLHDDIGASLSQIAILAEVARQRQNHSGVELSDSLERIAETSRTLVDSMSDIVWAVNPDADSLGDLVYRMRRFAEDTLGGMDIDLAFRAREVPEDLRLGADVRREIYLMLKESVTNIAKHSLCTAATVDFECDRRYLRLRVTDDGKGFDLAERTDGHGIVSMQRRGAALGGQLVIRSAPGQGTTVLFEIDRHQVAAETG